MSTPQNPYTHGPLGAVFAKTALPIILVMGLNGLLAVADALFLGHYVGAAALGAVTLMFPLYMFITALATLVASGMSSILARHLGAGHINAAQRVFAGAHGLALLIAALLIVAFWQFGAPLVLLIAGGNAALATMGALYIGIIVMFTPLAFVLALNSDALRCEGRIGFMALVSVLVALANIACNYVLIALLDMGVAGSAYGTALAQGLAFGVLVVFRLWGRTVLRLSALMQNSLVAGWRRIIALGAPPSLNFMGIALGAAAIIAALQLVQTPRMADTIAAYGIVTRIQTFMFLPLLGLSFAMQSITGNNFGAQMWQRSDDSLRIAITVALVYSALAQLVLNLCARQIGAAFVSETVVIDEVARIMPAMTALYILAGPLMMIGGYFQAIGDASRAAILGLSRTYLFVLPLTLILPRLLGEAWIWRVAPISEALLLLLTLAVLAQTARKHGRRRGLFFAR